MNRSLTVALAALVAVLAVTWWVLDEDVGDATPATIERADDARPGAATPPPTDDTPEELPRVEEDAAPEELAPSGLAAPQEHAPDDDLRRLALRGRVVDEGDAPVAGARVGLSLSRAARARFDLPYFYMTDGVPHDRLPVTVSADDGTFALAADEVADRDGRGRETRDTEPDAGTAVYVTARGFAPTTRTVPPDGWDHDLGDLVLRAGAAVTARLVDPDGRPLPGARFFVPTLARSVPPRPDWTLVRELFTTEAGPDGRVLLEGLPPDRYFRFETEAPGRLPATPSTELAAGRTADLGDVVLEPGHVLAGRVTDVAGRPVAGASIKLRPATLHGDAGDDPLVQHSSISMSSAGRELVLTTGADGGFVADTLPTDTHTVLVVAEGFEPVALPDVAPDGDPLEIVLEHEGLLVIRVTDASTGEPLIDADAYVQRAVRGDGRGGSAGLLVGTQAASRLPGGALPDGEPQTPGVLVAAPAGRDGSHVTVRAPGHVPVEREAPGAGPGEVVELVVELPAACSVSGLVTDGAGEPVPGARVRAVCTSDPSARSDSTRTDEHGAFVLADLASGTWDLTASAKGARPSPPHRVQVADRQALDGVELVLAPSGVVTGTVLDPDGLAVPGHRVVARHSLLGPKSGAPGRDADDAGRFRFEGMPAGPVTLTARPGARVVVDAVPGTEVDAVLQLREAARVHGRVTLADGTPVGAVVQVTLESEAGWAGGQGASDDSGRYAVEDIEPGAGVVFARRDGRPRTPAVPVRLDWGDELVVDLRFGDGRITGRVLADGTDEPVAGVTVEADRRDGPGADVDRVPAMRARDESDADGRFTLEGLAPGTWRLVPRGSQWVPAVDLDDRNALATLDVVVDDELVERDVRVRAAATVTGDVELVGAVDDAQLSMMFDRIERPTPDGQRSVWGIPTEGRYTVRGLLAGTYRWEVRYNGRFPPRPDQDHVFASGTVVVTPGGTTELDLVLVAPEGG